VTAAGGITRWQGGSFRYYPGVPGLPATGAQAVFEDHRGRIWMGTYSGLVYFDHGKFVTVEGQPGNDIVSITGDAQNLWLAGPGDLALFRDDRLVRKFTWTEVGNVNRGFIVADRGGVWVGHTVTGGVRFFKDGKTRETYSAADGLGAGHVASLRLDRDGAMWAATESGLSRIKDGRVQTLTRENGLPCKSIHWSIEDDRQRLWLYTSCGLVRVTHEGLVAWIADPTRGVDTRRWSAGDGLRIRPMPPYYAASVAKAADGRLWFVDGEGIQVFDPEHLSFNPIPPPVYVEEVVADRKAYRVANGMRLPPLARDITLEFTALSLTDAHSLQFRYRLEGHDTQWQDAGSRRQAFYTNLGPGEFRFHVKASNNNGVWNEQGAELQFFIAPAYYQTKWFLLGCVLLAGGLVWVGFLLHAGRVRREENRLRNVIEGIPTLAFSVYPDGSLDLVNQRWLDYFGVKPGAQSLSDWRSALHPDDVATHLGKWRAAITSGEPFENEARHRNAAGAYRWFLVRAVPLRDAHQKIVKWYGTLTDIEERKRAEDERERLRRLEAELAHTNRLSMLGELTATIAHEINQPIGATVASAAAGLRWLDREVPALPEARDAFARIQDDGKRAADIITALKAFYKKDALPRRVPVDVNDVVREMLVLLRGEADRHFVTMRTELGADLPAVHANRVQLQQVLMNLMVNGIEAMEEAGGELVIRTGQANGQVEVSVTDAGVGIPPDRMEQIFNSFTTTKAAGTGMGLAISRTIVESHEGRLWAEANAGRGATFSFALPAAGADRSAPPHI
jgi:PAS domain S-box-containing protein